MPRSWCEPSGPKRPAGRSLRSRAGDAATIGPPLAMNTDVGIARRRRSRSRRRRVMKTRWYVILASAAVLAIAAASVGATETAGKAAAGKAPGGKELFVSYKCTSCHSIQTEKIEKKKAEPAEG